MSSVTSDAAAESSLNSPSAASPPGEAVRLRDLSPVQWKSGIAAWLGWMFDGLDMHLYTIVAYPFVYQLVHPETVGSLVAIDKSDHDVGLKSSIIGASFLLGWALGGGIFGRLGDRLGRSKALALTILTYAAFTGLSFFAHTWWQLMIFRFVAALGIGGEWAVGSALLAETWPTRWRPWVAAVLQTGVNVGVMLAAGVTFVFACLTSDTNPYRYRGVFLVGIVPALIVFWIRKSVPEPTEWLAARELRGKTRSNTDHHAKPPTPPFTDLFRGQVRWITARTTVVCACGLTAWWAFMFWINNLLRKVPDIADWPAKDVERLVSINFFVMIGVSILGNFFAGGLAKLVGYRRAIALMFLGFFLAMIGTCAMPLNHVSHVSLMCWVPCVGFFSGVFGLFTMYLPPLFPTLLRTTGAGFCYNIGRVAAAVGTVVFGLFANYINLRQSLLFNSFLLIPAILVAMTLPDLMDGRRTDG